MNTRNWDDFEKELLKKPGMAKAMKDAEPEYQLARSLIAARIKKRVSQVQLAKKAKTDQATISRLESGLARPSLNLLQKIAQALGMPLTLRFGI